MKTGSVKRWTKYILIFFSTAVMLGLIFVSVALMICDDDDYRRLVTWGAERATGYRVTVEGPFAVDLSIQPALTAERIQFEAAPGDPAPILKSIGRIGIKIDLLRLLLGTVVVKQLQVADVTIGSKKSTKPPMSGGLPDIDLPVLENISLKNIRLTDADHKVQFQLNRFVLDDVQDSGPLILTGDGSVHGTDFQIEGHLGTVNDLLGHDRPFPVEINLNYADLNLSVSGSVADYEKVKGLNLKIAAQELDLEQLFSIFQVNFPLPGHMNFSALLSGDLETPRISDLNLTITDDPSVQISVRGEITNLRNGEGTDILIAVQCRDQELLQAIFPDDWARITELHFDGKLREVLPGYRIEDISARVVNIKGLELESDGWLSLGSLSENLVTVREVDLNLHLTSPQTEPIRPLLTELIPEIGSVDARGRLIGPVERLALENLTIIRGGTGPVRAEFRGRIGWIPLPEDEHVSDMDLAVTVQARQSTILSTFYGVPIGEIGNVTLTSRIHGATDQFQLEDIEFHSTDENGLKTRMSGGINFAEQANGEMLGDVKFELEITAPNLGAAKPLLGANLVPALGPVSVKGFVRGTSDVVAIEGIDITAGRPDNVQVEWRGRVGKFPLGGDDPIAEVQTFGSLEAANSSDIAELFGFKLPDIGPVHATWRETDHRGVYAVDDLKFTAGDGKTFQINATGRVASFIQENEVAFNGVDFKLELKGSDTNNLFKLLGVQLPDLGAVNGRATLVGGRERLILENLKLDVRSPKGLLIKATGGVGSIDLEKDRPFRNIDLKLSARAPNFSAVPLEGEWRLPDLGPLMATARIGDRDSSVNIEKFDIRAGPRQKNLLHLHGSLDSIDRREKMKLSAAFRADSGPWLEKEFQRTPTLSPHFAGTIKLSSLKDQLRIDKFQMATEEVGGWTILSYGTIKPGDGSPDLDLHVVSEARDPAALGKMFGMNLPQMSPLTIDGRYTASKQERLFEGETRLGDTRIQTLARKPVDPSRSRLEARLSSQTIHLDDLGFYPEYTEEKAASSQTEATSSKKHIFDNKPLPLDNPSANEFLVMVHADRIIGKNVELGPLDIDVASEEGRLRVEASDLRYRRGRISFEAILDTTGEIPRITVKLTADDMAAKDILLYLHENPALEGQLHLVLDMHSRGQSSRELAANLTGEFGVAIENGRIKRGVEMIASDALDLLFTGPAKDTYTDLKCMVGRLEFEKGVGTIQILYLDTPGVRARGFGSINLASETVDIVIEPISKRRLFRYSSPVRIEGQLGDPSVSKIPASEVAILAGQLAVPIIALPARALGILSSVISEDKDEESPCLTDALLNAESKK